jgi:hypothetical protein
VVPVSGVPHASVSIASNVEKMPLTHENISSAARFSAIVGHFDE